jgi:hypothetical protein
MAIITYDTLKQQLEAGGGLNVPASDTTGGQGISGTFTGTTVINVPQLPVIDFPMEDLTLSSTITGAKQDLNILLGLKDGKGGKQNGYAGSQILINSDRLILNSRLDYLMLFGQEGVAISSQGNVNIDADDAVTIYGEDGLYLGVPGKGKSLEEGGGNKKQPKTKADATLDNNYEPAVLGVKLYNLIEDLLVVMKNAVIASPVGLAYFREDTQYELACIQARLPEMLSTFAYVDGLSHSPVDPPPEPPKTLTAPPTTLVGTTTLTIDTTGQVDPNAASDKIANPLADQPDFYETEELYPN